MRLRWTLVVALALVATATATLTVTAGAPTATASTKPAARKPAAPTSCGAKATSSSPVVVATDRGAVRGAAEHVADAATSGSQPDVRAWRGIPYAAPPIGALRWQAPQPAPCRSDVLDTTVFGPPCPQLQGTEVIGNEDCLTVNVWRPARGKQPRAVMVFVHGGGHVQGSASQTTAGVALYDGAELAARGDVVVVTLQYRLGTFGWLVDDALATPGATPAGNYGLLDQIAALQWVQRNIAGFGGDPKRVLVFGESAGAVDTCLLVASPLAKGLFSRALIESGACVASDAATAHQAAASFATAAGCTDAAQAASCLRALPLDTVMHTLPGVIDLASLGRPRYGPYVDGRVLPEDPLTRIRRGAANHVPVVVGSNADESALFVRSLPTTPDAYAAALTSMVSAGLAARVLAAYPVEQYASPGAALIAATTDPRFTCSAANTVQALVAGQSQPVYRYFFTHTMDGGVLRALGAFHGVELFFVFGHVGSTGYVPSAGEVALSDAMIGYWSRFAKTGDPNGGGAVVWPRATAGADPYLSLDATITAGDGVRTAQCDFWSSLTR
ncbi:MAG: carboxylesterase/lipase family protein [Acidimicrobiia bacterium]